MDRDSLSLYTHEAFLVKETDSKCINILRSKVLFYHVLFRVTIDGLRFLFQYIPKGYNSASSHKYLE